ncbi:MAG: MMPL family transporter [Alphaproteobacteria bacterium]|nr:MMPL family transporter [Alphaproteobacteria bacterium]
MNAIPGRASAPPPRRALRARLAAAAAGWIVFTGRRPRLALLLVLAITLMLAPGFARLRVDTGYGSFAASDGPAARDYERFVATFGSDLVTLVYVRSDGGLAAPALAAIERLTRGLEALPYVATVASLFTVRDPRRDGDAVVLAPFLADPGEDTARLAARAAANPFVRDLLLSRDGKASAIIVTMGDDWSRERDADRTTRDFERLLAAERAGFDAIFELGPPRIMAEQRRAVFADMAILGPLAVLVLAGCFAFLLRAWIAVILPVATAGISLVWTFGLCGLTGMPINLLSAGIPLLLVAIGATEDAFMLSSYLHRLRANPGGGRRAAIDGMAEDCGLASLLTATTTVAGFAANAITPIPLIETFALETSAGLALNYLATTLVLPACLALFGPTRVRPPSPRRRFLAADAMVERLMPWWRRHPRTVLVGSAAVGIATLAAVPFLHPVNDPIAAFRPDHPLPRGAAAITRDLAGPIVLYVVLEQERPGFFAQAEGVALLRRVAERVARVPGFAKTLSLGDQLALIDHAFRPPDADGPVADADALTAQYLLLLRPNETARFVSADRASANILVLHGVSDSHALAERLDALATDLDAIVGGAARWTFSGRNVLVQRAASDLIVGSMTSFLVVVAACAVLIALGLGSVHLALLSLCPNLLPAAGVALLMLAAGIPLNAGTALVEAVAFGVIIDDTIHLLASFRRRVDGGATPEAAVAGAVEECVRPALAVGLAMAAALALCGLSEMAIVADFGLLAAFALLVALPAELLVTPALLTRLAPGRRTGA